MNQKCYRVVFNQARSLLMAVAETTTSQSKASGATSAAASNRGRRYVAAIKPLTCFVWVLFGMATIPLAQAQIMADPSAPGQQRPTVLTAPNGVPLVNIQTPSAAGVSRNSYRQFDVQPSGAILNNSRVNASTQLGGWVAANPWLATGPARVILNEVNSSNPSLLRGFVEVAGKQAQLVIANPAGITCNGCGFINANRATLTTGVPTINGGNLDGFLVQRGLVTVEGQGMDARSTDYTDIIARALQLNAGIWASQLKVMTGANQVSLAPDSGAPSISSTVNASPAAAAPSFAIDSSQLGGMYANKITLLATEAGVGVRNAGAIYAGVGDVVINAQGQLQNAGHITSGGQTDIDTQGGFQNTGTVYAKTNTAITTRGHINNSGNQAIIAANGNTTLNATGADSQINSVNGSVLAAGVQTDGNIGASGNLTLIAAQSIATQGRNLSGGDQVLRAQAADLSNSQIRARNLSVTASSGAINLSRSTAVASQTLAANSNQTLRTDNANIFANQINASAHDLSNVHGKITQIGNEDMVLNLLGGLDNTSGRITSNSANTRIHAGTLNNTAGSIEHVGTGTMTVAANTLVNQHGKITSHADAIVTTERFDNAEGSLITAGSLDLQASNFNNTNGVLAATDTLTVRSAPVNIHGTTFNNTTGLIRSAKRVTLTVDNLINANTHGADQGIESVDININAANIANNNGSIRANNKISINSSGVINNHSGLISAIDTVAIQDSNANKSLALSNTNGTIVAGKNINLNAFSLSGDGTIFSKTDLSIALASDFNNTNSGEVMANGNAHLTSARHINNNGTLQAGRTLTVAANTITNAATLVAGSVRLQASQLVLNLGPQAFIGASDRNGQLQIFAPQIINRDDITDTDTSAKTSIVGLGSVVLAGGGSSGHYNAAQMVRNESGRISSGADMTVVANTLTNTRHVLQTDTTYIPTGQTVQGRAVWTSNTPNVPGGRYIEPPHGGYWNSDYLYTDYQGVLARNHITRISPKALIEAGGNLNPLVARLQNYWSAITVAGNVPLNGVTLDQDSWKNGNSMHPGVAITPYSESAIYSGTYTYRTYRGIHWKNHWGPTSPVLTALGGYDPSLIVGGTLSGSGNTVINTSGAGSSLPLGSQSDLHIPTISSGPLTGISSLLPKFNLPSGGLYHTNTTPGSHYLIETNPAFTSHQQWLGSDYYFAQLGLDSSKMQKRLGDAYYEQQLVMEQLINLRGCDIMDYPDLQSQYQALMQAGAAYAKTLNLAPGVALSAAQVAQLNHDVVIMQEAQVNGQMVLVPVVYLSAHHAANLVPTGSLISAKNIALTKSQNIVNSGTIRARQSLSLDAQDINNQGGNLESGELMRLDSKNDINLTSAAITASSLHLDANHNILLNTAATQVSSTVQGGSRQSTQFGQTASIKVAGDAFIRAGANLEQNAGNITVGGNLQANIGGNWNMGAVQGSEITRVQTATGHSNTDIVQQHTSRLAVAGSSSLQVKRDLTAQGANITLQGPATLQTGGNLNLGAVKDGIRVDSASASSRHQEATKSYDETVRGTSLRAGSNLNLMSGHDISLSGSNLSNDQGVVQLLATRNVNLSSETEHHQNDSYHIGRHSGLFNSKTTTTRDSLNQTINQATTLSGQRVNIQSGHDVNINASNVVSDQGTDIRAQNNLSITAASNQTTEHHYRQERKSGLMSSGGIGFSFGTRQQSSNQASTDQSAAASTIGATQGSINLQAGSQYQQTGSDVLAPQGGINIQAKTVTIKEAREHSQNQIEQKFKQSGLTLSISNPVISALQTANQMHQAAKDTADPRMKLLAAGASIMAANQAAKAVQAKPSQAGGIRVSLSLGSASSQGQTTQSSNTARGSNLQASRDITISASGNQQSSDITIQGSKVQANNNIQLKADHDVNLQAAANTASQHSTNKSTSSSVSISYGTGGWGGSIAGSKGRGNADGSDTTWSNTHVEAGHQLNIQANNDVNLKGAVASADQVSVKAKNNLNVESLQDSSTFDSKQQNIAASIGVGGEAGANLNFGKSKINSNYQSVTEQSAIQARDGGFNVQVGNTTKLKGGAITSSQVAIDNHKNQFSSNTTTISDIQNQASYQASSISASLSSNPGSSVGIGGDSNQASSTTQSAISGIAGNKAARTGDAQTGIAKIFDANQVQQEINAQTQITKEFGAQASRAIGDYANQKIADLKNEQIKEVSKANPNIEKLQALQLEQQKWEEGGSYRIALHATTGALTGGVPGAAGAATAAAAAPMLNDWQDQVSQHLQNAGLNPSIAQTTAKLITTAAATGVSAAAGGNGAAAAAGFNVDVNNRQLHWSEVQIIKYLAKNDPRKEARFTAAACAMVLCYAEYPDGSQAYNELKKLADVGASAAFADERQQLSQQQGLFDYSRAGWLSDQNIDAAKRINNTYQVTTRALGVGQATFGTIGAGAALTTAPVSCATGIGCVANAAVVTLSADVAYAGAKQAISGQPESTYLNQALQGLGLSPQAAGYAEFAFGVGAAAKAGGAVNSAVDRTVRLSDPINNSAHSAISGLNLNKSLASEAQLAELLMDGGISIIGSGSQKALRDAARLAAEYGGEAGDWSKVASRSYTYTDGSIFEIHAYRNVKTGQVVEPKSILLHK